MSAVLDGPGQCDKAPAPAQRAQRDPRLLWWLGAPLLIGCLALAASQGAYAIGLADLPRLWALWWRPADAPFDPELTAAQVFWHIRAPRLLMAALAGSALGVAGAVMQGLFRNPLADPGLIGVSAGAALGAACCIVLLPLLGLMPIGFAAGLSGMGITMLGAFAGGVTVTALAWRLANTQGQVQLANLLLVGLAINALAMAGLGLLTYLANDTQQRALNFWLLGSLAPSQWATVAAVLAPTVAALVAARWLMRPLDALALGEAQARAMGVNVKRLQTVCVGMTAVAVGAVTAVIGMVGFIGLLAPHLVRLLMGPRHGVVLHGAALTGACLVVLADTAARTVAAPVELPLGVLTGLIGAPVFLYLLRQRGTRP